MSDREIIETGDGGAAAWIAGMLVVALLVVSAFFYLGLTRSDAKVIDIGAPQMADTAIAD